MRLCFTLGICASLLVRPATAGAVTGPYIMTFHACDNAAANCRDPRNHRVYLTESTDGVTWNALRGWAPVAGSVPDVIQKGRKLYVYTARNELIRFDAGTDRQEAALPVTVSGLTSGFVDPSLFIDEKGRLVLFFLYGQIGGDPASCLPGQSSCVKRFGSATEVEGSDGTQFTLDDGDRANVTISPSGPIITASDPDIFFDGRQYILYITYGPSISVWTSSQLRGRYTQISIPPGGLLSQATGGIPSGHFDPATRRYWTYAHVSRDGVAVIRRAVHADFARQLSESDWSNVVTGASLGLSSTTNVESPGLAVFSPESAPASSRSFAVSDRAGVSIVAARTSAGGNGVNPTVGYARIQADAQSIAPSGVAIFGYRQGEKLMSEASVPASPMIRSGRVYAVNETGATVARTGLAIANPNNAAATVSFFSTDANGIDSPQRSTTIPANGQIAAFLDESPFNVSNAATTFTFNSSLPVSAIALRGFVNERSEFLISTLPVIALPLAFIQTGVLPHFADGGGWRTRILLINPGDPAISGSVQFPQTVTVDGQTENTFAYSIPARSSRRLTTSGAGTTVRSGAISVVPSAGSATPSAVAIFSYKPQGYTVSEASVVAGRTGTAFQMYAERSGNFDAAESGSIQTGVAIANTSASPAVVNFELTTLAGLNTGTTGTTSIPANGQAALFLTQIPGFESLTTPFQGILRVTTPSAPGVAVIGLRTRYNEDGNFLITTTPPANESESTAGEWMFPHFVVDAGYTTQFILAGSSGRSSTGTLQFLSQSGQPLSLVLR